MIRSLSRPVLAAALLLPLVALAVPAHAQERSATRGSMTLTVSKATGLAVAGEKVRVRGSGYDTTKGIYVAFCVVNGPGEVPTPCGGGADTEGRSGNSVWISDFPPAYGTGLARPYGPGGTFDVEISVRAQLDEEVDCRTVQCAVITRADHTRSEDRSADVIVPVAFGAARPASAPPATASPGGGTTPAPPSREAPTQTTAPPRATTPSGSSTASPPSSTSGVATLPSSPAAAPMPSASPADAALEPSAAPSETVAAAGGDPGSRRSSETRATAPVPEDSNGAVSWPLAAGAVLMLAGIGVAAARELLRRRAVRAAS